MVIKLEKLNAENLRFQRKIEEQVFLSKTKIDEKRIKRERTYQVIDKRFKTESTILKRRHFNKIQDFEVLFKANQKQKVSKLNQAIDKNLQKYGRA